MIKYALLGVYLLGHVLDMIFTVLYIKKAKEAIPDAETLEVNYHRYFMKKFGIVKGAIISCMISLAIITSVYLFIYSRTWLSAITFIIGVQWGVVYVNFISVFNMHDIIKKAKKLREYAKEH